MSESVAFGRRAKGLKNAPAIRGNVLTRAPAKRLIEKINSTLRIKVGAKARLAKRKEGQAVGEKGLCCGGVPKCLFYLGEKIYINIFIAEHQSCIHSRVGTLDPSSIKEFSPLSKLSGLYLLSGLK